MNEGSTDHGSTLGIDGFAQGEVYNAARPDYPDDAVAHMVATLGIGPSSDVVDLGAGTGILTRQLRDHVGRIIAVDPSASMRDAFSAYTPGVEVLEGSGEHIPLDDAVVDAVFVAQAFHWFNAPVALREIHRVLKEDGGLGLIWNERDSSCAWIRELHRVMLWDERPPYDASLNWASIIAAGPFRDVNHSVFVRRQLLSQDQLLQRVMTTSYITVMTHDERAQIAREVADVLAELSDPLEVPYIANVYTGFADHEVEPDTQ